MLLQTNYYLGSKGSFFPKKKIRTENLFFNNLSLQLSGRSTEWTLLSQQYGHSKKFKAKSVLLFLHLFCIFYVLLIDAVS